MAKTDINDILDMEIEMVKRNRYMTAEEKEAKIKQLQAQKTKK